MEKMVEKKDEQFTLPDLVATKEGEEMPEEERELLKPLPKPSIKLRAYPRKGFNKEKIKVGGSNAERTAETESRGATTTRH